ncbi:MAG: hypothetical protein RLZZ292_2011, partial [Bacteroidota bacterium]
KQMSHRATRWVGRIKVFPSSHFEERDKWVASVEKK